MCEKKMEVSFSEMYSFKNCRQRWDYAYRRQITTKTDAPPLFLGSQFHSALEKYYGDQKMTVSTIVNLFLDSVETRVLELTKKYPNLSEHIEELEFQKNLGEAMIRGYHAFARMNDNFTVEEINGKSPIEIKFAVPVITPNGNPSSKFVFTGKLDGIVKYMGKYWVHEIKTSRIWSEGDIDLLPIDPQCLGYAYGAQKYLGIEIAGVIYSVTKKSSLRLKKSEDESEFRERVIQDYADRPSHYYVRTPVYLHQKEIEEFGLALWEIMKDMSPNPRIYKSVGKATCGFGCSFRRLCTAVTERDKGVILETFFRKKTAKHEELAKKKV